MAAKDIRNLIISLFIAAAGIKLLLMLSSGYIKSSGIGGIDKIISSFEGIGNLLFYAAVAIALLLIPFYLSKKSDEKKEKQAGKMK